MNYLTNKQHFIGIKDSLDEIVGAYGGATYDKQNNQLFAYSRFHNEATIEDLPIKCEGEANHFSIYFPEKYMIANGTQSKIWERPDKVHALKLLLREFFGQAIGQSKVVGYYNQNGGIVQEDIIRVEMWIDFTYREGLSSLIDICSFLKGRLHQDSIGIEVNEDLFILV